VEAVTDEVSPPRALAESDDRSIFDCGRWSMNAWFSHHGWSNHVSGASRVSAIEYIETGRIVGYVALCAGQIERTFLPKSRQRNQPDPVPVTLLGQVAVDRAWQGRGYAAGLVEFALRTALKAAEKVGSFGVVMHPLDDGLRPFYARFGFHDLPFDPRRAMFVRMIDVAQSLRDAYESRKP
jgi:GNAT superfamily N-acetyltransferase